MGFFFLQDVNIDIVFSCCVLFLLIAFGAQHLLYRLVEILYVPCISKELNVVSLNHSFGFQP